jgi:transcriptional regulator with XRE-family HTH domain
MFNLGAIIKKERVRRSLSQSVLGKKVHCADCTISYWETGAGEPALFTCFALERVMGLEIGTLSTLRIMNDFERSLSEGITSRAADDQLRTLADNLIMDIDKFTKAMEERDGTRPQPREGEAPHNDGGPKEAPVAH